MNQLEEELHEIRKRLLEHARRRHPGMRYGPLSKATVENIVADKPTSMAELLYVHGVGPHIATTAGYLILEAVRKSLTNEERVSRAKLLFPEIEQDLEEIRKTLGEAINKIPVPGARPEEKKSCCPMCGNRDGVHAPDCWVED